MLFVIGTLSDGFGVAVLAAALGRATVAVVLDRIGVTLTNYVILHEHLDFRKGDTYFGAGWRRTRVPYVTIDEVTEGNRDIRVASFPQLSGGRLSTHRAWLSIEPIDRTEFVGDLRRLLELRKTTKQEAGRLSDPL